jgi:hypothetical protein
MNFARVEEMYSATLFSVAIAAVWGGVLWVVVMATVD